MRTFQKVIERARSRPTYEVSTEEVSVPEMILFLKRRLAALPKRQRLALVPLFEQQSRGEP